MISSTLAPDSTLLRLVWQFTALARGVSCCYLFVSVYVSERRGMRESVVAWCCIGERGWRSRVVGHHAPAEWKQASSR